MEDKLLAEDLTRLINEYEERQETETDEDEYRITKEGRLGDLWYNPETNVLHICFGRINGSALWKEVNPAGLH